MDYLDKKVSYQKNSWSNIGQELYISEILSRFKSGYYKKQITDLRIKLQRSKEEYDVGKALLPALTFSGRFEKRRTKENLKVYNSLIVIDIDKLENRQMQEVRANLSKDIYCSSFWKSPSAKGFKGLVNIEFKGEYLDQKIAHKTAFRKLSEYMLNEYQITLDKSGSDITRLCFVCDDKDLVLKDDYTIFTVDLGTEDLDKVDSKSKSKRKDVSLNGDRDLFYNPENRNDKHDRYTMGKIIRFLKKNELSITDSYDNWFRISSAIANSFTIEVGSNYFHQLSSMDKEKYDKEESENFLRNSYLHTSNKISFSTIVFLAIGKGYKQ